MHGDETSGRQLLMQLAVWLCEHRDTDLKASKIVNEMHLYLLPAMNPDGYRRGTRENRHVVDLNRDFPDRLESEGAKLLPSGKEEPETKAVMEWIKKGFFTGSAALHEGAVVANYPWDNRKYGRRGYSASPDDATFSYFAKLYADYHPTMHSSKDFNYIAHNCMELTLELSDDKAPSAALLPKLWEDNREALINLPIAVALEGFRAIVTDEEGHPLAATVRVEGIRKDYSTRPKFGDVYRPLAPGDYTIAISAASHLNQTLHVHIPVDRGVISPVHRVTMKPSKPREQLRIATSVAVQSNTVSTDWMLVLVWMTALTTVVAFGVYRVRKATKMHRRTILKS